MFDIFIEFAKRYGLTFDFRFDNLTFIFRFTNPKSNFRWQHSVTSEYINNSKMSEIDFAKCLCSMCPSTLFVEPITEQNKT